ncbi:MAG TPA: GxxExxY protein [Gemmatimonadaceae bacterium]|nr:GxxExxY protein [Gemmatimonadaceae bacterium]
MFRSPGSFDDNDLTRDIIGAAIEVHRLLGPGLLESTYRDCLCYELAECGFEIVAEPFVSIRYKRLRIERAFRPDLIVENQVLLELKHIEKILAIHEAQVRTYLRLTGLTVGILFNFNSVVLMNGIRRIELKRRPLPSLP